MIGVFDSGVGGFVAMKRLRELRPRADICYLADRKNAPYGTKSKEELIRLVGRDIRLLRDMGADKILAACCTACSVKDGLDSADKEGLFTIIAPTAKAAVNRTKNGKIALLCTYATAKSLAFNEEILKLDKSVSIKVKPSAELVRLTEAGFRDENFCLGEQEKVYRECEELKDFGADTVILGCTHFSHLRNTISQYLNADCVSAADEGAILMASLVKNEGEGKIRYICPEEASRAF